MQCSRWPPLTPRRTSTSSATRLRCVWAEPCATSYPRAPSPWRCSTPCAWARPMQVQTADQAQGTVGPASERLLSKGSRSHRRWRSAASTRRYERLAREGSLAWASRARSPSSEGRATGYGNTHPLCGRARLRERDDMQRPPSRERCLTDSPARGLPTRLHRRARAGAAGIAGAAARRAPRGSRRNGCRARPRRAASRRRGHHARRASVPPPPSAMLLVVRKGREEAVLEVFHRHEVTCPRDRSRDQHRPHGVQGHGRQKRSGKAGSDAKQVVVADLPVACCPGCSLATSAPASPPSWTARARPFPSSATKTPRANSCACSGPSTSVAASGSRVASRAAAKSATTGARKSRAMPPWCALPPARRRPREAGRPLDRRQRPPPALDPRQGAAMAVAESARNVVVHGRRAAGSGPQPHVSASGEAGDHVAHVGDHRRHPRRLPGAQAARGRPARSASSATASPVTPFVAVVGQLRQPQRPPGPRLRSSGRHGRADWRLRQRQPGRLRARSSRAPAERPTDRRCTVDLAAEVEAAARQSSSWPAITCSPAPTTSATAVWASPWPSPASPVASAARWSCPTVAGAAPCRAVPRRALARARELPA